MLVVLSFVCIFRPKHIQRQGLEYTGRSRSVLTIRFYFIVNRWQGLTGAEATAMQQKLGSGADAGKNAVSNEEMEKLKAALKAKDEALGGMKKQMELMGTSQLQEARDEFESEKARALDEMEKRHAEKMGEMSAALQAKDADASSIRNKLEEAEKST